MNILRNQNAVMAIISTIVMVASLRLIMGLRDALPLIVFFTVYFVLLAVLCEKADRGKRAREERERRESN